jgi:hypothetical protein
MIDRQKQISTFLVMLVTTSCLTAAHAADRAAVEPPTGGRLPVPKRMDTQKLLPSPNTFPPDVVLSPNSLEAQKNRSKTFPRADVAGLDYTKNPPEPLKMGTKDPDAMTKLLIADTRGKIHPVYLSYLRHFEEKPFSEMKDLSKELRFLLVDSSRSPILIAVNFKTKSGVATINAKELGKDNRVKHDETFELTAEQVESLRDKVTYPDLWSEVPFRKNHDGKYSYWILENWDGAKYQTATQYAPEAGLIKELGEELLGITNLLPTDTAKPVPADATKP